MSKSPEQTDTHIIDVETPTSMIVPLLVPIKGTGELRYYSGASSKSLFSVEFAARPWAHTGICPCVWEVIHVELETKQSYDVIRIVCTRQVNLKLPKLGANVLSPDSPLIEVYRVQDEGLLPIQGEPFELHRIVYPSFIWERGTLPVPFQPLDEYGHLPNQKTAVPAIMTPRESERCAIVNHGPRWVNIAHVNGEWELEILADRENAAAFAYELFDTPLPGEQVADPGWYIRVVYAGDVRFKLRVIRDFEIGDSPILCGKFKCDEIDAVPTQGAILSGPRYELQRPTDITYSSESQQLITVLEVAIGLIPFVGAAYDIAQFIYADITGKDFWGRDINEAMMAVMGVAAILPVAFSSSAVLRTIANLAKNRKAFRLLLQPGLSKQVAKVGGPEFVEAFSQASAREQGDILKQLKRFAKGQLTAIDFLKYVGKVLGENYRALLERRQVLTLFSDDLQSLRDPVLAFGYQRYLAKGKKATPMQWVMRQRQGRFHDRLKAALGENYAQVIKRAQDTGVLSRVPYDVFVLLRRRGGIIIDTYSELEPISRGYGKHLERDHLLEQRFYLTEIMDTFKESEGRCLLVAKNPAVAKQIPDYNLYVHSEKTAFLNGLIPKGTEDSWGFQQWWDAHVHTFESLGAPEIVLRVLEDEFRMVAKESGKKLIIRYNIDPNTFTKEANWFPDKLKTM